MGSGFPNDEHTTRSTTVTYDRMVIAQATGVVMELFGLMAESALETIERCADAQDRRVFDVACEIVMSGRSFSL